MIFKLPAGGTNQAEQIILRKLRVWIAALACACLVAGVVIGAAFSNSPAIIAQQPAESAAMSSREVARAPEALSASFAEIARRVEPAVVKINTVGEASAEVASEEGDEETAEEEAEDKGAEGTDANPLMELFRRRSRRPPVPRGVGSGFIVESSGVIITNQHVVEGATRIKVRLDSGEELFGRVIGTDEETDLAVVRVETKHPLPVAKLGNSEAVDVGDWVLAIGSPFDFDRTVTAGIISAKEREAPPPMNLVRFLQTDAAINRGNSGGPLVNMRGEVIGVNSQIATTTGDYNGIGFALPSNQTAFVYRQIMAEGKVRRGYLGINLDTVRTEFARVYGMPEAKGAIVTNVRDRESPAGSAGIKPGDVIVEFENQPIVSAQDLIARVAATAVGRNATLVYLRDAGASLERRTTQVKIGERPPPASYNVRPAAPDSAAPDANKDNPNAHARPRLGIKTSELTQQLAADLNMRDVRGLLVTEVTAGSIADDAEIRVNYIIQRVNRVSVASNEEFKRIVDNLKPGDPVVINALTPNGGGRSFEVILQFTFQ